MMRYFLCFAFSTSALCMHKNACSQKTTLHIDKSVTYQTIRNFSASDAWSCQFVGNWPDEKKNKIADWLFSMDTLQNGNAKGIGLSMWRYNIGAGSAEQGDSSSITDDWHRAPLFTATSVKNDERIKAQNWFLHAAKQRGVDQFLGFFNSAPVQLTVNGKAHATAGKCNIDSTNYTAFAQYAATAVKNIKKVTGIAFDFISPVNEPQWDWSDNKQEGSPYSNNNIYGVVKSFDKVFRQEKINSKILITESGQLNFLLSDHTSATKGKQVYNFFDAASANYVGNLSTVSKTIASHSYFTTSPIDKAVALRTKVKDEVAKIKDLEFWQSEYCVLGDNDGEIDGNHRDTTMRSALYVAKVIHTDIAVANATAWQWWLAITPYDYKDGLIYIDKNKTDGNFYDSKMLWALGNYSRFVRPGMQRIQAETDNKNILVSGYKDAAENKMVLVFVNASSAAQEVETGLTGKRICAYITDEQNDLAKKIVDAAAINLPAESVVTVIVE